MPLRPAIDEGDGRSTDDGQNDPGRPRPPPEPSWDPRDDEGEAAVGGWLVRQWIERQVAKNPRDRETFAILLEHAQGEKTYQQIAGERGMTLTALSSRIFEFKQKYIPRYKRWRSRTMVWVMLGGAVVIAVAAIVLWLLLRRPAEIGPDPSKLPPPPPAPVPSATLSVPPPFEPAEPPRPPVRDMKPRQ
jgi:hypothetical protein